MSSVLSVVKQRGYWKVVIHAARFVPDRLSDLALASKLVTDCAVLLRGWDFPHVDPHNPVVYFEDHAQQETDWQHHKELWQLYLSGQFVHFGGLWDDWQDESAWRRPPDHNWAPGRGVYVQTVVFSVMEFFEFAARLALTRAGADQMVVSFSLIGMAERQLLVEGGRMPFAHPRVSHSETYSYRRSFERSDLVATPRDHAAEATREILLRFQWEVSPAFVRGIQDTLGKP